MGLLKKLFGKKSPPPQKAAAPASAAPPAADADGVTPDSPPKAVVNYVFQQMATGATRDSLRDDLVGRGFHKKTADEYIDLVGKTMFKGR